MKFKGLDCILLIDDDKTANYFHRMVIKKANVEAHVKTLISGTDAIAYLTRAGEYSGYTEPLPGIIFCDINMPGMDGFDFVEEYKNLSISRNEDTIVVMLTTSFNPTDKDRAMQNPNIVAFLNKPLTVEKVNEIATRYYS